MKGKVALVSRSREITIKEYELPQVRPGDMLLKTEMAGVCGTDLHIADGHLDFILPEFRMVIGHETIGKVVELGEGLTEDGVGQPLSEGDSVIPYYARACGKCRLCLLGCPEACPNGTAIFFEHDPEMHPHFTGGYGEYLYVPSPYKVIKIPESLPLDCVMAFACAGPTTIRAHKYAGSVAPAENVVVQGTGPVGLFNLLYAASTSPRSLLSIGAPEKRLEVASALGATHTLDIEKTSEEDRKKVVMELTDGLGADRIHEASGNPKAVPEGMEFLRNRGKYLVIGQFSDRGTIPIKPHYITMKAYQMIGSNSFALSDIYDYLRFLECVPEMHDTIKGLISHRFPIKDAAKAIDVVRTTKGVKVVLIP